MTARTSPAVADTDPTTDGVPERIIGLAFDFTRTVLADPTFLDDFPPRATLCLIPDDDLEVATVTIERNIRSVRRGENVYFVHVHREADGTLTMQRSTS